MAYRRKNMRILGLDSSGIVASVAVVEDDVLVAEYTINYKKTHSQTLLPMLDEIVKFCTNFDVLVLDESLCAIHLNVLSEEKIRSFLEHKPRGLEVILTGHEVSQDMLDLADYATMMMKVKHPYDRKVMAREGIEF